jgi:ATP-NAD kinase N-terminal domain
MTTQPALALLASDTPRAQEAAAALAAKHHFVPLNEAETVVVLGGDGWMLHVLHQMLDAGRVIPAYGINLGTVGFLMNRAKSSRPLTERIERARPVAVHPLAMTATTGSGAEECFYAINEVSAFSSRLRPDRPRTICLPMARSCRLEPMFWHSRRSARSARAVGVEQFCPIITRLVSGCSIRISAPSRPLPIKRSCATSTR